MEFSQQLKFQLCRPLGVACFSMKQIEGEFLCCFDLVMIFEELNEESRWRERICGGGVKKETKLQFRKISTCEQFSINF